MYNNWSSYVFEQYNVFYKHLLQLTFCQDPYFPVCVFSEFVQFD